MHTFEYDMSWTKDNAEVLTYLHDNRETIGYSIIQDPLGSAATIFIDVPDKEDETVFRLKFL